MKKNMLTKIAAASATGLMMLSMVTMTAMGAPGEFGTPADGDYEASPALEYISIKKTVSANADAYHPAAEFSFSIVATEPENGENFNDTVIVKKGEAGGATIADGDTVQTNTSKKGPYTYGTDAADNVFQIVFDNSKFSMPGVYKYTVTEDSLGTDTNHITIDSKPKTLYVLVRGNGTSCEVYGAVMKEASETGDSLVKVDGFTNVYDNNNEFKDLVIKKTVTGAQGETNREFKFKLTIVSEDLRTKYVVSGNEDITEGSPDLTAGTEYEFDLKNGEEITIKQLAPGDTIHIEETEANTEGYTTKVNNIDNLLNVLSSEGSSVRMDTITDGQLEFINDRKAVSPTGIVMNFAPYIAMIGGAGALGVFFRRKRHDD